jgi:hypothetical protein
VPGETVHARSSLEQKAFKEGEELRAILKDPKTYGTDSFLCFDPGMGIRFKAGDLVGDLVICLECRKIRGYKGDLRDSWLLSEEGNARLLKIYNRMVPKPEAVAGEAEKFAEEAKAWLQGLEKAELTFLKIGPTEVSGPSFHGYPILHKKVLEEEKTSATLRAILSDPKSYSDRAYNCFDPGLGFRFRADGKENDLVICLTCSAIHAHKGEETKYWLLSKEGVERLTRIYLTNAPAEEKKK